ncbi:MAG: hypothetical protein J5892_02360 [Bacilli bacterium]|nr:hypothetical protein [Bacilli bacterium]
MNRDNNIEMITIQELDFHNRNNITANDMTNSFINEKMLLYPLYKPMSVNTKVANYKFFPYNNLKIECYCNLCKQRRIFTLHNSSYAWISMSIQGKQASAADELRGKDYFRIIGCGDCGHSLIVDFKVLSNDRILKIGQYPSIYDLNEEINNKPFIKELGNEYAGYYKKACSLYSFNTCIGALIYLRRIFEKLLIDCFNDNKDNLDFSEDEFLHYRIEDRVKKLKKYLPSLLFENGFNIIYARVSDGIHNLSEEECQEIFPILKCALEEILIQKLANLEREKRRKSIANELSNM